VKHRNSIVISVTIYEFHVIERQCPSPGAFPPVVKSEINFQENMTAE
jgi:hypothetical protein